MLQALRAAPANSGLRGQVVDQMLSDLTRPEHAATAGELAARTDDATARIRLTVRQAELTQNVADSARICWKLYEAHELPEQNLDWAVDRLIRGKMSSNAIDLVENRLRRRLAVPPELRRLLAEAYESEGRRQDALRAHASDQR
jgi:hypothetical protein